MRRSASRTTSSAGPAKPRESGTSRVSQAVHMLPGRRATISRAGIQAPRLDRGRFQNFTIEWACSGVKFPDWKDHRRSEASLLKVLSAGAINRGLRALLKEA